MKIQKALISFVMAMCVISHSNVYSAENNSSTAELEKEELCLEDDDEIHLYTRDNSRQETGVVFLEGDSDDNNTCCSCCVL